MLEITRDGEIFKEKSYLKIIYFLARCSGGRAKCYRFQYCFVFIFMTLKLFQILVNTLTKQ